jgi:hypothetical protein
MKNKYSLLVLCTLSTLFICSCEKERGCTDNNARNHSFLAEEDDGSCVYSTATFYASNGFYAGIPIMKIDVSVDGSAIGSITSVFPAGPGNCSAQGTLAYTFENGKKVDWNATVYLASGGVVFGSGQAAPLSSQDCIKINVTR